MDDIEIANEDRESARLNARLTVLLDNLESIKTIAEGEAEDEDKVRQILFISNKLLAKYKYKHKW